MRNLHYAKLIFITCWKHLAVTLKCNQHRMCPARACVKLKEITSKIYCHYPFRRTHSLMCSISISACDCVHNTIICGLALVCNIHVSCLSLPSPFSLCCSVPLFLSSYFLSVVKSLKMGNWHETTSDAIEPRMSLFQKRFTSERSNSEDSLHHHFHLLRGRLGITKVSGSLFCRHLGVLALQKCSQCRYCPGWASTFQTLCMTVWPCMLNVWPTCTCWDDPYCCSYWPVSMLTHQQGLYVVICSGLGDTADLNAKCHHDINVA